MGKRLHFEVGNCAGICARISEQDGAYRWEVARPDGSSIFGLAETDTDAVFGAMRGLFLLSPAGEPATITAVALAHAFCDGREKCPRHSTRYDR